MAMLSDVSSQIDSLGNWWEVEALHWVRNSTNPHEVARILQYIPVSHTDKYKDCLRKLKLEALREIYLSVNNSSSLLAAGTSDTLVDRILDECSASDCATDSVFDTKQPEQRISVDELHRLFQERCAKIPLPIWIRAAVHYRPRAIENLWDFAHQARAWPKALPEEGGSFMHPLATWAMNSKEPHPDSVFQGLYQTILSIFQAPRQSTDGPSSFSLILAKLHVLKFRLWLYYTRDPIRSCWDHIHNEFDFVTFCHTNGNRTAFAELLDRQAVFYCNAISIRDIIEKSGTYCTCTGAWGGMGFKTTECIWLDEGNLSCLQLLADELHRKGNLFCSSAIRKGLEHQSLHKKDIAIGSQADACVGPTLPSPEPLIRTHNKRRRMLRGAEFMHKYVDYLCRHLQLEIESVTSKVEDLSIPRDANHDTVHSAKSPGLKKRRSRLHFWAKRREE